MSRRTVLASAAASVVLAGVAGSGTADAATPDTATSPADGRARPGRPTVVLVHGAFADASSWNDVTIRLQRDGYTVHAPANPLRGIAPDADYLRTFLATLTGPIILAGHSYGGAVITNAATGNPAVRALVYIAAYALDQDETVGAANALGGGSALLGEHIVLRPFPGGGANDVEAYVDPAFFREVFAQDLTVSTAAAMAAAQRPLVASALGTPSGVPRVAEHPIVVPGGFERPGHPTRGRTRDGRSGQGTHRRDRQLAHRNDQSPAPGHGADHRSRAPMLTRVRDIAGTAP